MTGSDGGSLVPRRYGDRDVARILERAAELQRAEPSATDPGGLTLSELTEIAREAGIDPVLLRRAAAEVADEASADSIWGRLAGAPTTLRLERTVEGEIPPERFDAVIPRIQQATDGQGTASVVGRTLTWSSQTNDNTSSQQVLISSGDGRTLIRWEEQLTGLAGALFGGIVGGGGVGVGFAAAGSIAGAAGPVVLALAAPLVLGTGAYALARTIYTRQVRRRRARAAAVIDEIASYVAMHARAEETKRIPRGEGENDPVL